VQPRPRGRSQGQRDARTGFLLVLPALAFVAVFALYPLVFGAYISLTDWPLVGAYHFIGFGNYVSLIHNTVFIQSILFTLEYTAIVTPASSACTAKGATTRRAGARCSTPTLTAAPISRWSAATR